MADVLGDKDFSCGLNFSHDEASRLEFNVVEAEETERVDVCGGETVAVASSHDLQITEIEKRVDDI